MLTRGKGLTPREILGKTVYFSGRLFQIESKTKETHPGLIPEKIRDCLKLMLKLYTQSSTGSRVRSEDKREAKLMAKAVARQDVKSAKKAKMSVADVLPYEAELA